MRRELRVTNLALAILVGCAAGCEADVSRPAGPSMRPPPDGPIVPPPDQTPVRDDPNRIPQAELFACADPDAPRSSPARISRMGRPEWIAGANYGDHHFVGRLSTQITNRAAIRSQVVLPDGDDHPYSTYVEGESIDLPVLDQSFRLVGMGYKWGRDSSSAGAQARLQLLRPGGSWERAACFQNDRDASDECIRDFATAMLREEVLQAEPTEREVDQLFRLARRLVDAETYSSTTIHAVRAARSRTATMMARAAWMTHRGMFRSEMGEEDAGDGRRRLGDGELANALALALTDYGAFHALDAYTADAGPHPERRLQVIYDAYTDGTIAEPETIAEIVRTYAAGTAAPTPHLDEPEADAYYDEHWISPALRRFFREWLGYANAGDVFKDDLLATSAFESPRGAPTRHAKYSAQGHAAGSLDDDLDEVIARIVAENRDVLRQLLTTRRFLVRPQEPTPYASTRDLYDNQAAPYRNWVYNIDFDVVGPIADTPEARWRELPSTERAGVLTHPAWLSAHAGNFENDPNPVDRGKWILENLLCGWIDELPVGVEAMLDPETRDDSARHRLGVATEDNPYCVSCHGMMNPFGYPFEIYNHAGYVRATDHGASPDGSSALRFTPVHPDFAALQITEGDAVLVDGMRVESAIELMDVFASSRHVRQCFVRQSFRNFMGRDETRADACTLADMESAYETSDGSLIEMLVALFTSDTFLYRHDADEATTGGAR